LLKKKQKRKTKKKNKKEKQKRKTKKKNKKEKQNYFFISIKFSILFHYFFSAQNIN